MPTGHNPSFRCQRGPWRPRERQTVHPEQEDSGKPVLESGNRTATPTRELPWAIRRSRFPRRRKKPHRLYPVAPSLTRCDRNGGEAGYKSRVQDRQASPEDCPPWFGDSKFEPVCGEPSWHNPESGPTWPDLLPKKSTSTGRHIFRFRTAQDFGSSSRVSGQNTELTGPEDGCNPQIGLFSPQPLHHSLF